MRTRPRTRARRRARRARRARSGDDDDELLEGYTVKDEAANALAQGKAKSSRKGDLDIDMDVEDDTIQIDLRVTLQNVRDDSEEKEKWRTQVIHTDHENHQAAYVSAPDPQADNPNATKLVRSDKPQAPYPSGIPQAFIDDVHAETNASRVPPRAWQARSWPRTAARRQALLASVVRRAHDGLRRREQPHARSRTWPRPRARGMHAHAVRG